MLTARRWLQKSKAARRTGRAQRRRVGRWEGKERWFGRDELLKETG